MAAGRTVTGAGVGVGVETASGLRGPQAVNAATEARSAIRFFILRKSPPVAGMAALAGSKQLTLLRSPGGRASGAKSGFLLDFRKQCAELAAADRLDKLGVTRLNREA